MLAHEDYRDWRAVSYHLSRRDTRAINDLGPHFSPACLAYFHLGGLGIHGDDGIRSRLPRPCARRVAVFQEGSISVGTTECNHGAVVVHECSREIICHIGVRHSRLRVVSSVAHRTHDCYSPRIELVLPLGPNWLQLVSIVQT